MAVKAPSIQMLSIEARKKGLKVNHQEDLEGVLGLKYPGADLMFVTIYYGKPEELTYAQARRGLMGLLKAL